MATRKASARSALSRFACWLRSLSQVWVCPVGKCVTFTPFGIPTRIPPFGGSGQISNFQSFGCIKLSVLLCILGSKHRAPGAADFGKLRQRVPRIGVIGSA